MAGRLSLVRAALWNELERRRRATTVWNGCSSSSRPRRPKEKKPQKMKTEKKTNQNETKRNSRTWQLRGRFHFVFVLFFWKFIVIRAYLAGRAVAVFFSTPESPERKRKHSVLRSAEEFRPTGRRSFLPASLNNEAETDEESEKKSPRGGRGPNAPP